MLFLAHTCLLVDERERETRSYIPKGWFFGFLSLSLSRARAKKKKTKRRTEEAPVAHLPTDASSSSSSSSSFYRPTDRKERRKKGERKMPRRPEKKIVVMVAKGIMCWRENRVEFKKTIKKVSIASSSLFFPPSTKKKKTRAIYSPCRTSLFFSRTPEKTKKTKTCRSLSLFLSVSKHFRQKRRSFKPSRRFVVDRRKRRKREIFFSNTYKTLNSTASFFLFVVRV